jgi:hypothetical protein
MSDVQVSADIAAPADKIWALVSDLPRMGEWSPENTGGEWIGGATGPAVGVKFRGRNRKGFRRWSTTCTVTAADQSSRFTFEVTYGPVRISTWDYTLTAKGDGTTVVEEWTDRRPTWMRVGGAPVMGVLDRGDHNRRGMEQTLARLKTAAES